VARPPIWFFDPLLCGRIPKMLSRLKPFSPDSHRSFASPKRREAAVNASCSIERIPLQRSIFPLLIVLVCLSAAAIAQKAPPSKPFERFDGCVLEPDEWTDGDSFRVRLPDSRLEIFRLYFVDTTESRSRGKRSDEQAAYFGLTRTQAIDLGGQAKIFTASALAQPFTIYTRLAERFRTNSLLCNRCNPRRS
jgi:hypothetical protein